MRCVEMPHSRSHSEHAGIESPLSALRPVSDTNDTKMETTGETAETIAEVLNALEARINTSYNH